MLALVRKDLLSLLRLKRVAAIQVLYVAALAAMLVLTWPQGLMSWEADDAMLLGLMLGQVVLLVLVVPGIASVGITGEREANTLEMLYASRMSPLGIVLGKLVSTLSFPALLLICSLPFLGLLSYRGHVQSAQLFQACAVLAATAVLLGLSSLAISALCRQSATALVISYLVVLGLCGGLLVPAQLMLPTAAGLKAKILYYEQGLSPVAAMLSILRQSWRQEAMDLRVWPAWQVFLAAAGVLMAASLAIVTAKLGRPPSASEAFGKGTAEAQRSILRRVLVLIDDRKQRSPFGGGNPVVTKERRTSSLRSGRWAIRIFYVSLVLSLALAFMALSGGVEHSDLLSRVAGVIVAFQIGLIALVTPSLTSPAISSELESGTWECLRLTRLSAWRIFAGKLVPALFTALLPLLALAPAYGVVCYINQAFIPHFVRVLAIAAVAVVFCCLAGLACSCFMRTTARATVAAYLLTAVVFAVPLAAWLAAGTQLDQRLARWLCLPSPMVMSLAQLPEQASAYPSLFGLWEGHLALLGALCAAMLVLSWWRVKKLMRVGG